MAVGAYQTSNFAYQGAGAFAYQEIEGVAPPVVDVDSVGNWNLLKAGSRKKKKPLLIKFSDFETRDRYEAALREAAMPLVVAKTIESEITNNFQIEPKAEILEPDSDDDIILLAVIKRIFH